MKKVYVVINRYAGFPVGVFESEEKAMAAKETAASLLHARLKDDPQGQALGIYPMYLVEEITSEE